MDNIWRVAGREYQFKKELLLGDYLDLSDLIVDMSEGGNKYSTASVIMFAKNAHNLKDLAVLALEPVDPDQDPESLKLDVLKFKIEWVAEIIENFYSASATLDGAFLLSLKNRIEEGKNKTRSQKSKPSSKTSIKTSEAKH